MKIRAVEWHETESVILGVTVNKYQWRIQIEVDGKWESIPFVDLGVRPQGFDPDEVNLEDPK